MRPSTNILILSDEKPGHVTGSLGVLKSIEKVVDVQHVVLPVKLRLKFMRPLLKMALNALHNATAPLPPSSYSLLFRLAYGKKLRSIIEAAGNSEWVVSSGGDTSFLNSWIAKVAGVKNIYCSSLRGLNPSLFTLLISTKDMSQLDNAITVKLAPAPIDRQEIIQKGVEFKLEKKFGTNPLWAVLIGGDGAGYQFDNATMKAMANGLITLAAKHNAQLLLTTSRRTGIELEHTLRQVFSDNPSVGYAVYFNQKPEKVIMRFLGAAELVFCTAESGSMITESLAAGKPTYVMVPPRPGKQSFYKNFLNQHINAGHIKPVKTDALERLDIQSDMDTHFHPPEQDPIAELAEKIKPWIIQ